MSTRKKLKIKRPFVDLRYSNWLAQLAGLVVTKFFYLVAGRGAAKTTEFQTERLIDMVYDMPGAPVCWVSDTYINLQKNILPTLMEGLERKGLFENVHYVIEKRPIEYSADYIKQKVPKNLQEYFWRPYNKINSYKHTIIFFTGFNITFGSLDRPSSLAGRSYVHIFGDEVKFFPEAKIAKLTKAVRGYRMKYGDSPYYRGHTFTTDMPNTNNVGEYDWIMKQRNKMNIPFIMKLIKTAFVLNECLQQFIAAKESRDENEIKNKGNLYLRWLTRYRTIQFTEEASTFFYIASSYINADILTPEYFKDEFASDLDDVNVAILSMKPQLTQGKKFYANLAERHFYRDGNDPYFSNKFGLKDEIDCRILKYLDKTQPLDMSMDSGNMFSLTFGQYNPKSNEERILKTIYILPPEWTRELSDKVLRFFNTHENKTINFYYDRAANNYSKSKQDIASAIKKDIEKDKNGKPTGWKVILKSINQGNIPQHVEYSFMMELMSGNNTKLPKLLIDMFNCKELKSSLEKAETIINVAKDGTKRIGKKKTSEKLPFHRLPMESTNFSDSFKYMLCRDEWLRHVKHSLPINVGSVDVG